jgi:hypothetical protein
MPVSDRRRPAPRSGCLFVRRLLDDRNGWEVELSPLGS